MKRNQNTPYFIWIDLLTTGQNPEKDHILEVGCVITDQSLNQVSSSFQAPVKYSWEFLESLVGIHPLLIQECLESPYTLKNIESALCKFIQDKAPQRTLVGNNLAQRRLFLRKYLPEVLNSFSIEIDLKTLEGLCEQWYPEKYKKKPPLVSEFRVFPQILKNIDQFQWYRKNNLV